jgi:hypothetical protein
MCTVENARFGMFVVGIGIQRRSRLPPPTPWLAMAEDSCPYVETAGFADWSRTEA